MIVGIIGAGTMGSGIAQAFAMTDGYEVRLCDIKEEFAENGKAKVLKNLNFLVSKEKITQEKADEISGKIKTGLKDICTDCDLVIEVCPERMDIKKATFEELQNIHQNLLNLLVLYCSWFQFAYYKPHLLYQ